MDSSPNTWLIAHHTQQRMAEATGARLRGEAKAAQGTRSRRWFSRSSRPTFADAGRVEPA
jgi:predicted amino acid dehydrogenase